VVEVFVQDKTFKLVPVSDRDFVKQISSNAFVVALDLDGVITSPYALKAKYINEPSEL